MSGKVIRSPGSLSHDLPFSPAMQAGGHIYVSGTVPVDNRGRIVGIGDVRAQTRCVLESIRDVLQAAGASLGDVVNNQVFLADLADFGEMNEVYAEFFPRNPPARFCVQTPLVREEFLVEIAATAYVGD